MIEEIIPGNKTRLRIIKTIYENPGMHLTNLIKTTKASPNLILDYVNKLSLYNIIKEKQIKGKKKIHVRNIYPNFDNELSRLIFTSIELNKKILFFKKYKNIKPIFSQLEEISKNKQIFILIYGSFSRFSATKESDLDILIVGKLEKKEINRIREIFVTLDNELSLKIETTSQFIKNKNKPLHINILKEHIIIFNITKFLEILNKLS